MNVTFHMHTPPASDEPAKAGTMPAPVLYIRIDPGGDLHTGRSSSVVDREAIEDDKRRYKAAWAAFEAKKRALCPTTVDPKTLEAVPPSGGGGKKK